jgi:hypothetical protein
VRNLAELAEMIYVFCALSLIGYGPNVKHVFDKSLCASPLDAHLAPPKRVHD